MRAKHLFRITGVAALGCVGILGSSGGAFAASMPVPISTDSPLFIPLGGVPAPGKGVDITGNCSTTLLNSFVALEFVDGNGHVYGPTNHPDTNGANVEGSAYLLGLDTTQHPPVVLTAYFGQAHAWFGQNNLPPMGSPPPGNGASVDAQTFSFHGTNVDDPTQTLDVQGSFGSTLSASGHMSGWGHLKLTCS